MAMIDFVFRAGLAVIAGGVSAVAFRLVWRNHIANPSRARALHVAAVILLPMVAFWALLAAFGRFPGDVWLSRFKDIVVIAGVYGLIGLIRQEEDL